MAASIENGDAAPVDRGVGDIRGDASCVLSLSDDLYVVCRQRQYDGSVLMSSDNKLYEPHPITNGARHTFKVLGRVVMAWNARRM